MDQVKVDIMVLNNRVAQLESIKTDVENRLRKLERAVYLATGMLMLLQLWLKYGGK